MCVAPPISKSFYRNTNSPSEQFGAYSVSNCEGKKYFFASQSISEKNSTCISTVKISNEEDGYNEQVF